MPNTKPETVTLTNGTNHSASTAKQKIVGNGTNPIKVEPSDLSDSEQILASGLGGDAKINPGTPRDSKARNSPKRENSTAPDATASAKRTSSSLSRDEGAKQPPEKKQKVKKEKEKKPKTTGRNKGPIDLDKQCGVIALPNNIPCTRSLTCKTHSMASKRAVAGRSQPYDTLLQQYQKKSIGRPQNANQAGFKFDPTKKDGTKPEGAEKIEEEEVDSEAETSLVMKAIRSSNPKPLASIPALYAAAPKTNYFNYKNMLSEALQDEN